MRYAHDFLLAYVAFLLLSAGMVGRPDSDVSEPARLWALFWQEAGIDGCTEAFPASVRSAIALRWRSLFSTAATGAQVLDICCGRGAVLGHASRAGLAELTGVDLAVLPSGPFNIQGGIDAVTLPFADRSFTIVTSQFGIEYAGLPAAGTEAARVAEAHLWLLLHAAEGPIVAQGSTQVEQIAWLSDDIDTFGRLRRHVEQPTAATTADVTALRAAIVARAETANNTALLEAVWQAVPTIIDNADPPSAIDQLAEDLATHRERLKAMIAAAPTRAATEALAAELLTSGFVVGIEDMGSPPAARWLIASRQAREETQWNSGAGY